MKRNHYKSMETFEKYWGEKAYHEVANKLRNENNQIAFTKDEKLQMLSEMISYIGDEDYRLYHDFMDYACQQQERWFNFLVFDRKARDIILTYIKSRVQEKQSPVEKQKTIKIDESSISHEEPIERNCTTCEFYSSVCMGYGKRTDNGQYAYGMPIEEALEMFPNGCEDYGVSLDTYEILEERDGR